MKQAMSGNMNADLPDLYAILETNPGATQNDIKKCYQKQMLKYHPDKIDPASSLGSKKTAEKMYADVAMAWQVLSNQDKRKEYDSKLKEEKLNISMPLYDTVTIDDLDWDEDTECYCYMCRCGGEYALSESDAEQCIELVCCDTCTLGLQIVYPAETKTSVEEGIESPR